MRWGVVSNVFFLFPICAYLMFPTTNESTKHWCFQLLYVRRTEPPSDFTDESCQRHPLHSRSLENNIASEPFVTKEQWLSLNRLQMKWQLETRKGGEFELYLDNIHKNSTLWEIMTHLSVHLPYQCVMGWSMDIWISTVYNFALCVVKLFL